MGMIEAGASHDALDRLSHAWRVSQEESQRVRELRRQTVARMSLENGLEFGDRAGERAVRRASQRLEVSMLALRSAQQAQGPFSLGKRIERRLGQFRAG